VDATERHAVWIKSAEIARELWKRLVNNVGQPDARKIMHHVMGDKKPGRRKTDENEALLYFIYSYIRRTGLTDAKIARLISESNPRHVQYESGLIGVVNDEITETYMSLDDDPIVDRWPITKGYSAIRKQAERIRRWTIEEGLLPTEYAPRPYHRD
jgi:hypothetical protein